MASPETLMLLSELRGFILLVKSRSVRSQSKSASSRDGAVFNDSNSFEVIVGNQPLNYSNNTGSSQKVEFNTSINADSALVAAAGERILDCEPSWSPELWGSVVVPLTPSESKVVDLMVKNAVLGYPRISGTLSNGRSSMTTAFPPSQHRSRIHRPVWLKQSKDHHVTEVDYKEYDMLYNFEGHYEYSQLDFLFLQKLRIVNKAGHKYLILPKLWLNSKENGTHCLNSFRFHQLYNLQSAAQFAQEKDPLRYFPYFTIGMYLADLIKSKLYRHSTDIIKEKVNDLKAPLERVAREYSIASEESLTHFARSTCFKTMVDIFKQKDFEKFNHIVITTQRRAILGKARVKFFSTNQFSVKIWIAHYILCYYSIFTKNNSTDKDYGALDKLFAVPILELLTPIHECTELFLCKLLTIGTELLASDLIQSNESVLNAKRKKKKKKKKSNAGSNSNSNNTNCKIDINNGSKGEDSSDDDLQESVSMSRDDVGHEQAINYINSKHKSKFDILMTQISSNDPPSYTASSSEAHVQVEVRAPTAFKGEGAPDAAPKTEAAISRDEKSTQVTPDVKASGKIKPFQPTISTPERLHPSHKSASPNSNHSHYSPSLVLEPVAQKGNSSVAISDTLKVGFNESPSTETTAVLESTDNITIKGIATKVSQSEATSNSDCQVPIVLEVRSDSLAPVNKIVETASKLQDKESPLEASSGMSYSFLEIKLLLSEAHRSVLLNKEAMKRNDKSSVIQGNSPKVLSTSHSLHSAINIGVPNNLVMRSPETLMAWNADSMSDDGSNHSDTIVAWTTSKNRMGLKYPSPQNISYDSNQLSMRALLPLQPLYETSKMLNSNNPGSPIYNNSGGGCFPIASPTPSLQSAPSSIGSSVFSANTPAIPAAFVPSSLRAAPAPFDKKGSAVLSSTDVPYNSDIKVLDDKLYIQSVLSKEIVNFVDSVDKRNLQTQKLKLEAFKRLRGAVMSLWPRAQVKLFGSFVSGLSIASSDMDLVICLPKVQVEAGPEAPGDLEGRNAVKETWQQNLHRCLSKEDWIETQSIKVIGNAVVPVIKLRTKSFDELGGGVSLDISFESPVHKGLEANKLIVCLLLKYPHLRPLLIVLKSCLAKRGLGDNYSGGLSSYALCIMVSKYLQELETSKNPALGLTDLGSILLGFLRFFGEEFDPKMTGINLNEKKYIVRYIQSISHPPFPAPQPYYFTHSKMTQADRSNSFNSGGSSRHQLYSSASMSPSTQSVMSHHSSINTPAYLPYTQEFYKFDPLYIEDPLDSSNNVGRNCFRIMQVQKTFCDVVNGIENKLNDLLNRKLSFRNYSSGALISDNLSLLEIMGCNI